MKKSTSSQVTAHTDKNMISISKNTAGETNPTKNYGANKDIYDAKSDAEKIRKSVYRPCYYKMLVKRLTLRSKFRLDYIKLKSE